jgi:hypothetical protein|eukprot:COSAG02_NODE_69_length_42323_cov_23.507850_33_plen_480_part_00
MLHLIVLFGALPLVARASSTAKAATQPVKCSVRDGVVFVDECGSGFGARDAAGQPDHTDVIQAALNSSAKTVVLRNLSSSSPWIARPLFIHSNDSVLRFESNAFLHAKRGRACRKAGQDTCFHGTSDSMIRVKATHNVTISGDRGATIRMWKQDYMNSTEYMKGEWRMGIYLGHEANNESAFERCRDMTIKGPLNIEQSGGDGIYIDQCERVTLTEVNADGNYRQGLSIIGAKDLLVERSNFSNTHGTAPAAGIDLEPDGAYYDLENITIRDCHAVNNTGHGLQSWLNSGDAHNISVLIERYYVVGSSAHPHSGGFVFGRLHPPGGSIIVRDSTVTNTAFDGIYVWDELLANDASPTNRCEPGCDFHLIFSNVTLHDTATAVGELSPYSNQPGFTPQLYAPIGLDSLAGYGDSGLELNDITVHDALRRPFLQANPKWGGRSVTGALVVVKKVIQPMPGCDINASQPFFNLTVHCDIISQ